MKKHPVLSASLLMMSGLLCSACSEDDNKPKHIIDPPLSVVNVQYNLDYSADMAECMNLTVSYVVSSSDTVSETVTSLPWTKSFTTGDVHILPSLTVTYSRKPYATFDKEQYTFTGHLSISAGFNSEPSKHTQNSSFQRAIKNTADNLNQFFTMMEQHPDTLNLSLTDTAQ